MRQAFAIVVGNKGVTIADAGNIRTLDAPDWWHDPVALLDKTAERYLSPGSPFREGTVIWASEWGENDGERIAARGWEFGGELTSPYCSFRRAGVTINVGLLYALPTDRKVLPLFDVEDHWELIVKRLRDYQCATGVAWRGRPGINGVQMLRELYTDPNPGKQPRWFLSKGPGSAGFKGRMWPAGDLMWRRDPTAVELHEGVTYRYDITAQYVAAAANILPAWGELEHTGEVPFKTAQPGTRAGYWLIEYDSICNWPAPLPPVVGRRKVQKNGRIWLTTPIMQLLADQDCLPDVHDSWTAPGRRFLVPWSEKFRAIRLGMAGVSTQDKWLMTACKNTANEAVGFFGRRGGRCYRPDWQHGIIDLARANTLRKLFAVWKATGEVPLRCDYDSVWYVRGAATDYMQTIAVPNTIGKFRYVETESIEGALGKVAGK